MRRQADHKKPRPFRRLAKPVTMVVNRGNTRRSLRHRCRKQLIETLLRLRLLRLPRQQEYHLLRVDQLQLEHEEVRKVDGVVDGIGNRGQAGVDEFADAHKKPGRNIPELASRRRQLRRQWR